MKKFGIFSLLLTVLALSSCIKNTEVLYSDSKVEIDAATWNANAAGVTYPILGRIAKESGRAASTTFPADSTLRRYSQTIRVRINLVGEQSAKDETVGYKTFDSPIASIVFPATTLFTSPIGTAGRQEPAAASATLSVLTAVAGTHYGVLSGKVTIPAKSSFGYIDIAVLPQGPTAGQARFIGIQLDSSGSMRPFPNYDRIGLVIDQR
jgi:hypothetical protein